MDEGRMMSERKTELVLGQPVEIGTLQSVSELILSQAERRMSSYVCFTTAHMLVESLSDATIRAAYAEAKMILPDGVPVAWGLRSLGHPDAECISGPRLTPALLRQAAERGVSVGFYGGRPDTLDRMTAALARDLPNLKISYVCSPPFRDLDDEEQSRLLEEINASGAQMLFVGLGSPKQDIWMRKNATHIQGVCLGVGAAFEFLSGEKYLPPEWIQRLGLTWLVRLCQEPRRLIRRNLASPVFAFLFLRQRLLGARFNQREVSERESR